MWKLRNGQLATVSGLDENENEIVEVRGKCRVLGTPYCVEGIKAIDLLAWMSGIPIQNAMPYLSRENREFLVSGTSPEGWAEIFSGE